MLYYTILRSEFNEGRLQIRQVSEQDHAAQWELNVKRIIQNGFTALFDESQRPTTLLFLVGEEGPGVRNSIESECPGIMVVQVIPADWNSDCTPWRAPGLRKKDPWFGGQADKMLAFILETTVPTVKACGQWPDCPEKAALAGYSLGGLLVLYGLYRGLPFGVYGSLSGSLWYPGWTQYAREHMPPAGVWAYLSLGDREPLTKNPVLQSVGEATLQTSETLQRQLGKKNVLFEWNQGNHFVGIEDRFAKFARYLKMISSV